MDRNFGAEIDSLKTDIEEIKKLMREIVAKDVDGMMESMDTENISDTVKQTIHTVTKGQMHPDPSVNDIMEKAVKETKTTVRSPISGHSHRVAERQNG